MSCIFSRRFAVNLVLTAFILSAFPAGLYCEDKVHTVKSGETAYTLARRYGVKAEEILFINGIEDARKIMAGQKLRIPSGPIMLQPVSAGKKAPPSEIVEHKVVKGDTLYGIARKYGVSYQSLLDTNDYQKNTVLRIGETVKIAVSPAAEQYALPPDKKIAPIPSRPENALVKNTPPPRSEQKAPALKPASRIVDTRLKWPVKIKEAAYMTGKLDGVILTGEKAASVQSLSAGTVASASPYRGFGRVAIVRADSGYIYVYGGCETLSVRAGERVLPGTELGRLGIDAVSQKPRLFFMVYNGSQAIDPAKAPRT